MATYRTQRVLPIILVIVIIIIAVAALVSLARAVFFSDGGNNAAEIDQSRSALLNSSEGHSVSMTVRGPIVADEEFQSYQTTITPSTRTLTTYSGYLSAVVDQVSLPNNTSAYEEFTHALDKARLADGEEFVGERDDVRGICAKGRVYEFFINDNGETVKRLWTSTCGGSKGSLDANVDQLRALFVAQFPEGQDLIRKINL